MKNRIKRLLVLLLAILMFASCFGTASAASSLADKTYKGKAVVKVNKDVPKFTRKQKKAQKVKGNVLQTRQIRQHRDV